MACKWVSQTFKQPGLLSSSEVANSTNKIALVGVLPAQWDPVACISESWKLSRVGSCLAHRAPWSVLNGHRLQSLRYKGEVDFSPPQNKCHKDTLILFLITELREPLLTRRRNDSNWGKPQYMYGFDRSLRNALKEPQKAFSFAGALPTSFSVRERKNKEDWEFCIWPVRLGSELRKAGVHLDICFRVKKLALENGVECALLFTFCGWQNFLISNFRIKHHLVVWGIY